MHHRGAVGDYLSNRCDSGVGVRSSPASSALRTARSVTDAELGEDAGNVILDGPLGRSLRNSADGGEQLLIRHILEHVSAGTRAYAIEYGVAVVECSENQCIADRQQQGLSEDPRISPVTGPAAANEHELIGWVSGAPQRESWDTVIPVTFSTTLYEYGTLPVWAGFLRDDRLVTMHYLVWPTKPYSWDHISAFQETWTRSP